MMNKDDLTSGIQTFIFDTGTPGEMQSNENQINIYHVIYTDQSEPSVNNVHSLLIPEAVSISLELIQARDISIWTRVFLTPLLGKTHCLVDGFT